MQEETKGAFCLRLISSWSPLLYCTDLSLGLTSRRHLILCHGWNLFLWARLPLPSYVSLGDLCCFPGLFPYLEIEDDGNDDDPTNHLARYYLLSFLKQETFNVLENCIKNKLY
jgi:hypothetical protein